MKKAFLILSLCFIAFPLIAQERELPAKRRVLRLPPQLMENAETHIANGMAQSPMGYPINIGVDPLPRGSIIGLYGTILRRNEVNRVLIMANGKEYPLAALVVPDLFPKLERVVFRLPSEITGEVAVSAVGLTESNWVRFFVE